MSRPILPTIPGEVFAAGGEIARALFPRAANPDATATCRSPATASPQGTGEAMSANTNRTRRRATPRARCLRSAESVYACLTGMSIESDFSPDRNARSILSVAPTPLAKRGLRSAFDVCPAARRKSDVDRAGERSAKEND